MNIEKNLPQVSIIIRCFNEDRHIGHLLESLKKQTFQDFEVILVDSGSTDKTLDIARNYDVKIIHILPEEFTFGYSLNKGLEAAKGEFLVMASAHILPVHEDWLLELKKPFKDPKVAKVYGRQIGNFDSRFSEHEVFAKQFPETSNFKQTIPFCNNANSCIRKSLWFEKKYDETLTGLEDLDWAKWAISQNYYIAYNANAAIIHIHHESPSKIYNRYMREAIALKRIFPDSHMFFREFVAYSVSNIFNDMVRAIKKRTFFKFCFEIIMFRSLQYWGTYKGLKNRTDMTHEVMMRFYYPRTLNKISKIKSAIK